MAHRAFRGRGISQSQRRKKAWIGVKTPIPGAVSQTGFTTAVVLAVPTGPGIIGASTAIVFGVINPGTGTQGSELSNLPEESTILRARGSLLFPKTTFDSLTGTIIDQYSFGFGVTDIRSIVAGAVPKPITDVDWDGWMFIRSSALPPVEANSGVLDVKSMRKIKTGDAFFLVAEAIGASTSPSVAADFVFDLRLLMLLP